MSSCLNCWGLWGRAYQNLPGFGRDRHDEVAGALGRGAGQSRGLDLQETTLVQGPAHGLGHRVAQLQVGEHLGTADVQIAPLHARDLIGLDAILNGEGRRHRRVQHLYRIGQNFDLARDHVRVDRLRCTLAHAPGHLQHVLATQVLGRMEVLLAHTIGIDHHLGIAITVAQVDEYAGCCGRGCATPNRTKPPLGSHQNGCSCPQVAVCMQYSLRESSIVVSLLLGVETVQTRP